ncbi:glycoside hydrolase family 13 protein [Deinococcus sp. KSM4-11]|uniref:glycoside hydrolase family 13 protein n=1 Tax=Deinococcus sp. KSM4-11 TaxID=2568654 RepID=UPI0010A550F8|nr:glycoside hydrolase family 13 protein [Deinococcus sp. KSM4-11]THF88618.1 glycoside hydrolase family 13 protein [Deinococcus sp. KSM4-11]
MSGAHWLFPHHDGSETYVPEPHARLGGTVDVLLRVPHGSDVTSAWVRVINDGEPELVAASLDRRTARDTWLRARLPVVNPVVSYRWLLDGGPYGYQWLNGSGLQQHDVPDAADFRISVFEPPPSWATDTMYQIFPDRFARAVERSAPAWAVPADWDDPVIGEGPDTPRQFYGGDLDGVAAHLDHLASLGVGTIYLTPFFPAESNHRYNASTFNEVDPLLGGDEAMARLSAAARERGMHLMGDLTTNHCGNTHEWFQAGLADPDSAEAGFFFYTEHPHAYDAWWGMPEMPIFDHRSAELRRRLYDGPDSVVARWLGPQALAAWRIDVANMTGIHGDINLSHLVATTIRKTMASVTSENFLQAESNHDASRDLLGDGYQGTMNYAAFTRPLWQWLLPPQEQPYRHTKYPVLPNLPGGPVVAAMRAVSGVTPWQATLHAMNLIGSHDTHRIASLLGDARLVDVAFGMLAAYPGVPMIYAGDELGLEAMGPEYARIPMPWAHPERWNTHRLESTRALFQARAASEALRRGGLRWLWVGDDVLVFLREAPGETVLVQAARASYKPVRLPVGVVGTHLTGLAGTPDVEAGADGTVALPADGPAFGLWRLAAVE